MKPRLLDLMRCPKCGNRFTLEAKQTGPSGEIEQGQLKCGTCSTSHRIHQGIPRFVQEDLSAPKAVTAKRFGDQWHVFPDLGEVWERQLFDEYILPLKPDIFKGQICLEAGCGRGRNLVSMASYGAKDVVGVDLSSGAELAYQRTKNLPNVHVIQGDIYAMPVFREFDLVFSAGVLHHLPDPKKGYECVVAHGRPGALAVNTVYGKENNEWIEDYVNPLRLAVTRHMPPLLLFALSNLIALPAYLILLLVYKPVNEIKALSPLREKLFYNDFAYLMIREGFKGFAAQIFDQLSAPTANFHSKVELEDWVRTVHLQQVQFFWRNKNCWNFIGTKP